MENNNIPDNKQEYTDISNFSNTQPVDINKKYENINASTGEFARFSKTETFGDFSEMASFSEPVSENTDGVSIQRHVRKSAKKEKHEAKVRNNRKRRKNRMLFRFVWAAFVIILGIYAGLLLSKGANDVFAMDRQKTPKNVEISVHDKASANEVADILAKAKVIEEPDFFKLYCKVKNIHTFVRGDFSIPTDMDYEEIIDFLFSRSNRVDVVEIMFYEGINLLEVAQLLEENEVAKASEVIEAANSTLFDEYDIISEITDTNGKYYKIEGYLFPDTYQFYKGEGAEDALSKLIYNGQRKIMTKKIQARLTELNMSYDDLIIMASLIQAEAASISEMDEIASVIYNRLEDGHLYDIWTLGLDSTIFYPYRTEDDVPEELGDYSSDYNTYVINGMPEGAICNPGIYAIEAALYPADTDYYYFLHGKDGLTYFAETADEHEQNLYDSGLYE